MKKFILLFAIAILFTIFSCTPDEYETQPTKKIEKPIDKTRADGGPGDDKTPPPPPNPVD